MKNILIKTIVPFYLGMALAYIGIDFIAHPLEFSIVLIPTILLIQIKEHLICNNQ